MDAASIFVLCLAAGFVIVIAYLVLVSRRTVKPDRDANQRKSGTDG
jgi:hypothetical protein